MKKILFNASIYRHFVLFHLPFMELLQNKGYEVHAAASNMDGGKEILEKKNIITHDISYERNPFKIGNMKAYFSLKTLLKNNHYQFIHTHTPVASFLIRMAARKTKQKVLYTAHGFHFFKGAPKKNWLIYYNLEKIAAKWTDGLIVMNKEDWEISKTKLGFKPNKNLFFTHGVGVDLDYYGLSKKVQKITVSQIEKLEKKENSCYFINIGDFIKRKRQMVLIKAWKKFMEQNQKQNFFLLFVGKGPKLEKCQNYVKEKNINNIFFLGYRKDVPKLLSFSDVGILISAHEGLPRCVMEMMTAGKPVIGSDVRGTRDLINNNENGILVELDNEEEIVRALNEMIKDKETRIKLGEKGQERIKKYELSNVLKEIEEIYNIMFDIDK